jgi:Glu-tRNA(Gln) amidotransferase subunit E-like FAD-binding protein
MAETTDIEKKSLEAHVELCAERYRNLDDRLDTVNEKIGGLEIIIREVHDMVHKMTEKRNDQIINWGVAIIGTLVGVVGWLVVSYVIK